MGVVRVGRSRPHGPRLSEGDDLRSRGPVGYGSNPARRAAATVSPRVCVPSLRIADRR